MSREASADTAQLQFFGRITAGVTHELNNVIAIIRELSGLMDDLMIGAEQSGRVNTEKFKSIINRISDQTVRGEEIVKRLNRFAHSVDVPERDINILETLRDVCALSQRFASVKNIEIILQDAEESGCVTTNPYLFQLAVFSCIDFFFQNIDQFGAVAVQCDAAAEEKTVTISGTPVQSDDSMKEHIRNLEENLSNSGYASRTEMTEEEKRISFVLELSSQNNG